MTEVSKERREQWKQECDATKVVWSDEPDGAEIVIHADELRALLDMADERDRYRTLLEEARQRLYDDGRLGSLAHRIDAALEGKTND